MIPLKYVSTRDIIDHGQYIKLMTKGHYDCGSDTLIQYKIKNFAELQEYIASNHPDFQKQELLSLLDQTMEVCEAIDEHTTIHSIFFFDAYKNAQIDEETCRLTDFEESCSSLILTSPLNFTSSFARRISNMSIAEAKDLLSSVNTRGINMFISKNNNYGPKKAKRIASAINFYDEQIIRSAKEHPDYDGNLFTVDFNEKSIIVYEQIRDILAYLLCNSDNFVWGYLNSAQKTHLVECLEPKNIYDAKIKFHLIEMIVNYLTLNELKDGVVRKRTLDRFIKK